MITLKTLCLLYFGILEIDSKEVARQKADAIQENCRGLLAALRVFKSPTSVQSGVLAQIEKFLMAAAPHLESLRKESDGELYRFWKRELTQKIRNFVATKMSDESLIRFVESLEFRRFFDSYSILIGDNDWSSESIESSFAKPTIVARRVRHDEAQIP